MVSFDAAEPVVIIGFGQMGQVYNLIILEYLPFASNTFFT